MRSSLVAFFLGRFWLGCFIIWLVPKEVGGKWKNLSERRKRLFSSKVKTEFLSLPHRVPLGEEIEKRPGREYLLKNCLVHVVRLRILY